MNLAPNGKPSNLTPEQYRLVRTSAFKKWFGDWENDPENSSKVVDENGEPLVVYHGTYRDFSIFDLNKVGNVDKGFFSKGFYFTPNESLAYNYGNKIYKCYLNIKSPIITKSKNDLANYLGLEYNNNTYSELAREKIISLNYDGVLQEYNLPKGARALYPFIEIVAYFPNQIKLADGTNTTFDGNNPDIRFAKGGKTNNFVYSIGGL
jgi:hypothetical protein